MIVKLPLGRAERLTAATAVATTLLAGVLSSTRSGAMLTLAVSGLALAALSVLVGQATDRLGARFGPGATGVLQSALGNLPELFFAIVALRAGLVSVVQATLVGSILANSLLVLGLAFVVGGLRHGTQHFDARTPRLIATLLFLTVAALGVPTLAHGLHAAAGAHADTLSLVIALLLAIFAGSIPVSLAGGIPVSLASGSGRAVAATRADGASWPLPLIVAVLAAASGGVAFVSSWFVAALQPAATALHLAPVFIALVIVGIAGNAVENAVGVALAARDRSDYAISVILNSSLQVALGLTPVLVLLSFVVGPTHLTLVLPGLLLAALGLAAVIGVAVVYDGASNWLEGMALIGLYGIVAVAFWWG